MSRTKGKTYQQHAEDVAKLMGKDRRWDVNRGCWYVRNVHGIWREDETGETEYQLHQLAEAAAPGDDKLAGLMRKVLIHHPELAVTQKHWDQEKHLIGTPLGVFDLDDGQLVPEGYEYFVTKQTGARKGHPGDCPRWLAFLDQATRGDVELVAFLKRWCGYCLSGYTTEHALVFIYGPGGNGKGTFIETVQAALGEYAKTLPMESLMAQDSARHPADIAMLVHARLAVANETAEGKKWDESRIKTLTGGDTVTARFMRENYFHFVPEFKLCVVGNHAPTIGVVDDAMRRRLLVVPFDNKPAVVDGGLREALAGELRGILGWCFEGFKEWRERGLAPPERVRAATDDYLEDEDALGQFLAECVDLEPAEGGHGVYEVSTADVCRAYGEWAERVNVGRKSAKRLAGELKRRGFVYKRAAKWRGFKGLRIAQPDGEANGGYLVGGDR